MISLRRQLYLLFCLLLLGLLCREAAACADAVRAAVKLCLYSVIPSLFPFFAASSLAVSCGLAQAIGGRCAGLMRRVFHLPGCAAAVLALSFLGGYPSGARMAAECCDAGLCTKTEASAIAAVCNNTGPAFLIGLCGGGLFSSLRAGVFLYAVHMLSALLGAFLLRPKAVPPGRALPAPESIPAFPPLLIASVLSAGRACLQISAFVLFFSALLALARQTGFLPALTSICAPLLRPLGLTERGTRACFTGLCELTQGLAGLTADAGTPAARLTAVSVLCAFGGLSVLFQTAAAAPSLSFRACVRGKLVHAACALLLCLLFFRFFPISLLLPISETGTHGNSALFFAAAYGNRP